LWDNEKKGAKDSRIQGFKKTAGIRLKVYGIRFFREPETLNLGPFNTLNPGNVFGKNSLA
jgi:hypothetical protein